MNKQAKTILIVDDTEANNKILEIMLEDLGYAFEVAKDGVQAITFYAARHFDLVLMDGQMPILNGVQATVAIRAYEMARAGHRRTPILATTANTTQGYREECLEAGMDDYLMKPFDIEQLRTKLAKWTKD